MVESVVVLDFGSLNLTLTILNNLNTSKLTFSWLDTIFLIEDWAPYYIEGLEEGENQIKLELIDSNGNLIETPFNPSIKTFMIEK